MLTKKNIVFKRDFVARIVLNIRSGKLHLRRINLQLLNEYIILKHLNVNMKSIYILSSAAVSGYWLLIVVMFMMFNLNNN